ncbi:hypothetical protein WG66_006317 [Moniliophthora roreri]|nr:hypothetical protein WG66_006317 [Moniliophthora roreri]
MRLSLTSLNLNLLMALCILHYTYAMPFSYGETSESIVDSGALGTNGVQKMGRRQESNRDGGEHRRTVFEIDKVVLWPKVAAVQ